MALLAELERLSSAQAVEELKCWLGIAEARQGHFEASHRAGTSARNYGDRHGDYETRVMSRIALSELALAQGDHGAAAELAREAVSIATTGDWLVLQADARLLLARALKAAGEREQAADEASAARDLYQAKGHVAGIAKVTALGCLPPES